MNEMIQVTERQIGTDVVKTANARELYAFLEVASAFKDWIARRITDYGFEEGLDFCSFLSESSGGRPAKEYAITIDMAKELAMVERNDKGKQARMYFIECERLAKSMAVTPALPQTLSAALRFAADQADAREKAEAERDHAVATKALIGSKREATAMATASAANREAGKLRNELGCGIRFATVIAVERAAGRELDSQDWRPLKKWCETNGIAPTEVPDKRYGFVKAWPAAAWLAVHGIDLGELFGPAMAQSH